MLAARAVLMFVGRDGELVPQEAAALQPDQGRGRGVTPLRNKDDEGERLCGAVQELLHTHPHPHLGDFADAFIQSDLQQFIHTDGGVNHAGWQPARQEQLG